MTAIAPLGDFFSAEMAAIPQLGPFLSADMTSITPLGQKIKQKRAFDRNNTTRSEKFPVL